MTLTLTGFFNDATSTTSMSVNLHELTQSFVEGTGNASAGASNWTESSTGVNWTTAGGSFDSGVLATVTLNPRAVVGNTYVFTTSAGLVAAAQSALDGSAPLNLLLKAPDSFETGATSTRNIAFFSSDDVTTAANRPLLTIQYIPEPSSAVLIVAGSLMGLLRRRR